MSKLEETVQQNHDGLTKREILFQMAPVVGLFRIPYAILKEKPTIAEEVLLTKSWYPPAYGVYQGLSIVGAGFGAAYAYKLIEKFFT